MFPFALAISLLTILIVYPLYFLDHCGFGRVTVPEWFTGYNSKGLPEPFPYNDVIEYWKHKGKIIALNCGVVAFIGTFLFKFIKSQLNLKLGKTKGFRGVIR